jgi:hypothetical protein
MKHYKAGTYFGDTLGIIQILGEELFDDFYINIMKKEI